MTWASGKKCLTVLNPRFKDFHCFFLIWAMLKEIGMKVGHRLKWDKMVDHIETVKDDWSIESSQIRLLSKCFYGFIIRKWFKFLHFIGHKNLFIVVAYYFSLPVNQHEKCCLGRSNCKHGGVNKLHKHGKIFSFCQHFPEFISLSPYVFTTEKCEVRCTFYIPWIIS